MRLIKKQILIAVFVGMSLLQLLSVPSAMANGDTVIYRVKQGDTLFSLAKKFGTSVSALQLLNGLNGSTTILVNQDLRVVFDSLAGGSTEKNSPETLDAEELDTEVKEPQEAQEQTKPEQEEKKGINHSPFVKIVLLIGGVMMVLFMFITPNSSGRSNRKDDIFSQHYTRDRYP